MDSFQQYTVFEQCYFSIREKEGRLFRDDEVLRLPMLPTSHPLHNEWKLRAASCKRLINYFSAKRRPLHILEIGCGNGWLCNRLSGVPGAIVSGIDINKTELRQAARLFPQVDFIGRDIRELQPEKKFDAIVFAASIQYFPSIMEIMKACFSHVAHQGEIHILDSHFYATTELSEAKRRSDDYFRAAGFPQMEDFYFHHSLIDLEGFYYKVLYRPQALFNRLFHQNPFPWICIYP